MIKSENYNTENTLDNLSSNCLSCGALNIGASANYVSNDSYDDSSANGGSKTLSKKFSEVI